MTIFGLTASHISASFAPNTEHQIASEQFSEHLRRTTSYIDPGLRTARYHQSEYQYDAAGNLVQRRQGQELTRFAWDENNRLKTVRKTDDTRITMGYDALGRRHTKAVNGQRTFFTWDGDALLAEQFEDGPVREYVYYPGTFEPLAVIDGDGKVYYYHNDVNGLPQELTRHNGEIVWSATYDALGRVEKTLVDEVPQPLRMQGQYYDEETGLCYNRHRYFDPQIGSFISQDPIGLAGGDNVYAYAPNVWTWADPLGLSCDKAPKTIPALSDDLASTFMGNKYTSRVLDEDIIFYRAGTKDRPLGQFFSESPPVSEIQVRIDQAVLPKWPGGGTSPIDTGFKVKIPKGTAIYEGTIAPQGGFYLGGTKQIVVQKPWTIEGVEVLESFPLVK